MSLQSQHATLGGTHKLSSGRHDSDCDNEHDHQQPRVRERLLLIQMLLLVLEHIRCVVGDRERIPLPRRVVQIYPRRNVAAPSHISARGSFARQERTKNETHITSSMTAIPRLMRRIWSRVVSLTIDETASVPACAIESAPRSSAAKKAVGRSVASTLSAATRIGSLVYEVRTQAGTYPIMRRE